MLTWLNNQKLSIRIIISFTLITLFGVVSSIVAITSMSTATANAEKQNKIAEISELALKTGNQRRDFQISGDTIYVNQLGETISSINLLIDELEGSGISAAGQKVLTEMKQDIAEYEDIISALVAEENTEDEIAVEWEGFSNASFAALNSIINDESATDDVKMQALSTRTALLSTCIVSTFLRMEETPGRWAELQAGMEGALESAETLADMTGTIPGLKASGVAIVDNTNDFIESAKAYYSSIEAKNDVKTSMGTVASAIIGSTDKNGVASSGTALLAQLSDEEMAAQESSSRIIQIILVVTNALAGVLAGQILISGTVKPLNTLIKACDNLAVGDVAVILKNDTHMGDKRRDEMGQLSKSLHTVLLSQEQLANSFQKMANGDLTVEFKPRCERDDIGLAFTKMIGDLRSLMGKLVATSGGLTEAAKQLSNASDQAGHATQQIASTSQQVAKGASEQSSSLQSTTRAMEQLSSAIEQISKGAQEQSKGIERTLSTVKEVSASVVKVSDNAKSASAGALQSAQSAQKGAEKAQQTVGGMEKIKEAIGVASERVTKLGEQSSEIDKIVATIDDIAAQTNLLALNAAIEAARAGEQGRGFAVVADEVRKLAERSLGATKEIADLIGGIQKGVSEAVKAMEDGNHEIESGYKLAADAGTSLTDILQQAEALGKQVDQITQAADGLTKLSGELVKVSEEISSVVEENTAATEQMAASSDQVSKSVESVAGVAEENGAATEQVSASAQEMSAQVEQVVASAQSLSQMADELTKAVSVFKLDGKELEYSRN
jgi:methyl-accepting chemotaxis protein